MHAVVPAGKVLQVNHDDLAHLRSEGRPQEAQPRGSGRPSAVGGVREPPEHGLLVDAANPLRPFLQEFGSVTATGEEREEDAAAVRVNSARLQNIVKNVTTDKHVSRARQLDSTN